MLTLGNLCASESNTENLQLKERLKSLTETEKRLQQQLEAFSNRAEMEKEKKKRKGKERKGKERKKERKKERQK